MRYSNSPAFAAIQRCHTNAHAAWVALPEDTDDAIDEAASEEEKAALHALMLFPAQNAGDVLAKFDIYDERDMSMWEKGNADSYFEAIRSDLLALNRPIVSDEMALAFTAWANARREYFAAMDDDGDKGDERMDGLHNAEGDAFAALLKLPCSTPGDFIAKAYINLVDSEGSGPKGQYPFLPSGDDLGAGGSRDMEYAESVRRDIRDSDLGRCMMALGKVDFDAEAWVKAAIEVGAGFRVLIDRSDEGRRSFWQSMDIESDRPGDSERHRILQQLVGGAPFWRERSNAVCDYMQVHHPERCQSANMKRANEDGIADIADASNGPVPSGNGIRAKVDA